MASEAEDVDYERLERSLRALAYANRLELLHILRFPRALADVRLAPQQTRPGENPERPMARASLNEHVERLMDAGVVVQGRSAGEGTRAVNVYQVNPQRLYVILDELRRVFAIPGHSTFAPEATSPLAASSAPTQLPPGPKLLLVRGLLEGKVFPLRGPPSPQGWLIGRRAGLPVSLEYDPFVSVEHARVEPRSGERFVLVDLPAAKNGTTLNWAPMPSGGEAPLSPGDIIGVGRSLLVFRT